MPGILILGAGGLIGQFVAADLIRRGVRVTAAARRFSAAQRDVFGDAARETPIASLDVLGLKALIAQSGADVVLNCVGVLQDQPGKSTHEAHDGFVERLIAALCAVRRPVLLIHTSIPGEPGGDVTPFAQSKRRADGLIVESGLPHAILRPGHGARARALWRQRDAALARGIAGRSAARAGGAAVSLHRGGGHRRHGGAARRALATGRAHAPRSTI